MAGSEIPCLGFASLARIASVVTVFVAWPHAGDARAEDHAASTVIFGSLDAGPSAFATVGAKIGFDRVDREGFAVLASAGGGARTERGSSLRPGAAPILTRWTGLGAALLGYQWFRDWGVMAFYAGPEAGFEALSDSAVVKALPARFGLRLHAELWARPSAETLVTATVIAGSARGDLWTRLSYGVRLWDAYLGPEAALYTDGTGYRKWSFGLHATDVAFADIRLRISAGYLTESGTTGSPYVALAAWQSF